MSGRRFEIFCISNEILLGETLDTNSHWLCQQLTAMGGEVWRVVHLRDERDAVVEEFRRFVAHEGDVLITIGGLGPTDDDNTLNYIAAAAERPFEISNEALQLVQRRYEELHEGEKVQSSRLNETRKKMAYMPRGGMPVENPVGVAPGMMLETKQGIFISLPGEPAEMKAVFQGPQLKQVFNGLLAGAAYAEDSIVVSVRDEARLIPAMRHVRKRHGDILIKSRSFRDDSGLSFRVHLSAFAEEESKPVEVAKPSAAADGKPRTPSSQLPAIGTGRIKAITAQPATNGSEETDRARKTAQQRIEAAMTELREELENEGIEFRSAKPGDA